MHVHTQNAIYMITHATHKPCGQICAITQCQMTQLPAHTPKHVNATPLDSTRDRLHVWHLPCIVDMRKIYRYRTTTAYWSDGGERG
jgi:hypothetical protein